MIKKSILLFALSMMLVLGAKSQEFRGGFKAGINASQVAGDCCSGYDKAGLFGGAFVNVSISDNARLQMEIEYSEKGSKLVPDEDNGYQQYTLSLNYIDIPILYQYIYGKFIFEGGLSYGYLLSTFEEANFSDQVAGTEFNKSALNLIVGLYYRINENWMVNFRTTNSLMAVRDHASGVKRLFNRGQYNDVLTLSLVYEFKRGKR